MTTTDKSRADALTDQQHPELLKLEAAATPGPWRYQECSDAYTHIVRSDVNPGMIVAYGPQSLSGQVEADARFVAALRNAAPALLAASPVEQPEAAPFANCQFRVCDLPGQCRTEGACHHPKPSADAAAAQGDERAAFEAWYLHDMPHETYLLKRSHQHPEMYDDDSVEDAWTGWQARAAASQPAAAAGQEAAVYQILTEEGAWLDVPHKIYERKKSDPALTRVVYTAPPAQVATRQLTDEQRKSIWWAVLTAEADEPTPGSLMHRRAQDLRAILATQQPEPRAEVTVDARERRHWNPVYNTDPLQRACTELPDGYEIEIMLERDAGTVDVCGPDGGRLDVDFDEDTFDWKIHAAIDAAIDAARAGEGQ